jgi:predicted transcriptional regulator
MMMEILQLIQRGGLSLRDMSHELDIERRALEDRIDSLVRSGYVKEMKFSGECDLKKCKNCPMTSSCGNDQDYLPKIFELTDKGRRALHR